MRGGSPFQLDSLMRSSPLVDFAATVRLVSNIEHQLISVSVGRLQHGQFRVSDGGCNVLSPDSRGQPPPNGPHHPHPRHLNDGDGVDPALLMVFVNPLRYSRTQSNSALTAAFATSYAHGLKPSNSHAAAMNSIHPLSQGTRPRSMSGTNTAQRSPTHGVSASPLLRGMAGMPQVSSRHSSITSLPSFHNLGLLACGVTGRYRGSAGGGVGYVSRSSSNTSLSGMHNSSNIGSAGAIAGSTSQHLQPTVCTWS